MIISPSQCRIRNHILVLHRSPMISRKKCITKYDHDVAWLLKNMIINPCYSSFVSCCLYMVYAMSLGNFVHVDDFILFWEFGKTNATWGNLHPIFIAIFSSELRKIEAGVAICNYAYQTLRGGYIYPTTMEKLWQDFWHYCFLVSDEIW